VEILSGKPIYRFSNVQRVGFGGRWLTIVGISFFWGSAGNLSRDLLIALNNSLM
jgi:hypothetical protein